MSDRQDTIAAIATSPGRSGIGIVRVSGKNSLQIARNICNIEIRPRHAHFCHFKDSQNRSIDRGILLYFKAPNSFTGEDVVEFQGHGNQIVLKLLLDEILQQGARLARPGEFTERAYLNEKIDLVQAEAVADLINSVSEQAARSALRSLEGEFSGRISSVVSALVRTRVFVEGSLDFPEEEIDFLKDSDTARDLQQIIDDIDALIISANAGRRLQESTRVVIIGRPNVGKSSLLNRLLGVDRAIVTGIAGTTRDSVEDSVLLDGLSINIVDTAGLREPADPVEAEGIRRTLEEIGKAGIIILVTDQTMQEPDTMQTDISSDKLVVVHNKIDLQKHAPQGTYEDGAVHIFASMKTGEGLMLIRDALIQKLGAGDNSENVVLARSRHIQALTRARDIIQYSLAEFLVYGQGEILAEELNKAQQVLGEITGEFHSEDLLGEIFSRFCIGK